jgi:glutaredoxin
MAIIPVRLYALSTCVHCNALKRLLQKHNIEFEWTDVDLLPQDEQDDFFEQTAPHNPKKSFPIVIIGNKAIVGDQRELIARELGLPDEP